MKVNKMDIIVFDTETYGLILSLDENVENIDAWPPLKQLSWVTYSLNGSETSSNNYYFSKKDSTKEEVLRQFLEDVKLCQLLVAHNFLFDYKVVSAELLRHSIAITALESKPVYDSMTSNLDSNCKYPTLTELHTKLFGKGFEGAHDALNDAKATAECFWHLRSFDKINFEVLPDVKTAVQLEEEKIIEQLSVFYGSRKSLGEYLFRACEAGIIGKLIEDRKKEISGKRDISSNNPYSIYSDPKLVIDWSCKIEKAYLNGHNTEHKISQYIEYLSLTDTVDFLKSRELYFPDISIKITTKVIELLFSSPSKFGLQQKKQLELYEVIAYLVNSQQSYAKAIVEKPEQSTKPNSGCLLVSILFILTPVFIYVLYNLQ